MSPRRNFPATVIRYVTKVSYWYENEIKLSVGNSIFSSSHSTAKPFMGHSPLKSKKKSAPSFVGAVSMREIIEERAWLSMINSIFAHGIISKAYSNPYIVG